MPELPEVETVTQSVKRHLLGRQFDSIHVNWMKTLHNFTVSDFNNRVKDKAIENVYRRAKYILLDLGDALMGVHLRMTGKLYAVDSIDQSKKNISLYLKFDNKYLIFEDTRKFGRFYLFDSMEYLNERLGVEPLSKDFSKEWMLENMKSKNRQIKSLLLDQSFICGIGNIYASEILFLCKINPKKEAFKLTKKEGKKIISFSKIVLNKAIKKGGSSIRDFKNILGENGNFGFRKLI